MAYLYGDGTESELDYNYIEFIREAVALCVDILQVSVCIRDWRSTESQWHRASEAELEALATLEQRMRDALAASLSPVGDEPGQTQRCADKLLGHVDDEMTTAKASIRRDRDDKATRIKDELAIECGKTMKALAAFLADHNLPGMTERVRLWTASSKTGTSSYCAQLHVTALELAAIIDLDIPRDCVLAHPQRVEKFVGELEVAVPDKKGWINKKTKRVKEKLGRQYLTELDTDEEKIEIALRASPDAADIGFDIQVTRDSGTVMITRVTKDPSAQLSEKVRGADAERLLAFAEEVVAAAVDLTPHRKALVEAELDGVSLYQHEKPGVFVQRLISAMAPVVAKIERHSLKSDELVLKRTLAGGRREEIFVSRDELRDKISVLPNDVQLIFSPLGLTASSVGERQITSEPSVVVAAPQPEEVVVSQNTVVEEETIPIEDAWLEEPTYEQSRLAAAKD